MRSFWMVLFMSICAEVVYAETGPLDTQVSMWNLIIAGLTLVAAAVTIKNRVNSLEEKYQGEHRKMEQQQAAQALINAEFREKIHHNEKKLINQEKLILERLLKQEQILFDRLDERLNRFEHRIDFIIKAFGEGRRGGDILEP
ncbi:MAG: hypothetical protein A2527_11785 [Candidatus Lambdaproteobacteria bacterium RIFOXYD2_FULL_50_16]|uniref:Uncharacterized protein n=1 Tax=Candidatus Lambdaproteobacteria bacterium RIFOXYD2_FULL_50_16 TaxID=1817772 RepID=A0A1F6G641_9PROT|nr:MAG: hypothetical protein A2527_11785 [Candidatus Lambdaproteobacteria bacterium RIFOXYD2_FULL_50_16]